MIKNKYHSISSSDDETKEEKVSVKREPHQVEDRVATILSQKKGELLDFNSMDEKGMLFAEDITEDDEIWMVQAPAMVDTPLNNVSIDFDSPVSKMKCKVNGTRTRFNVYTITDSSPAINFLLPSKETKSFSPKTYPSSGKILLQQTLEIGEMKADSEVP